MHNKKSYKLWSYLLGASKNRKPKINRETEFQQGLYARNSLFLQALKFSALPRSARVATAIFGGKSCSPTRPLFLARAIHSVCNPHFVAHSFVSLKWRSLLGWFQSRPYHLPRAGFRSRNMVFAEHEISVLDFKTTSSSCIRFPSDSSTDSQTLFIDVELINYCPDVFSILQKYGKIDANDYITSICAQETMRQLGLYRKIASSIYLPRDDRFVVRIINKSELKVFLEMLPNYYHHVRKYKNTLLTKIYGLHVVKPSGRQKTGQPFSKVYFVVMGNVLHSDLCIHKRFDLKGSNRCGSSKTGVEESSKNEDDLDIVFHLDTAVRNMFMAQVKIDCDFLEDIGVTDYSLLLGVHLPSTALGDSIKCSARTDDRKSVSSQDGGSQSELDEDSSTTDSPQSGGRTDKTQCNLGVKLLARAVRKNGNGNSSRHRSTGKGRRYNIILFLEITDIMQCYGMAKRMGRVFMSASGRNPKAYSAHFQDFISQIFPQTDCVVNI